MTPKEQARPLSSIVWTAAEDEIVITKKMSDEQVWNRCRLFGQQRLIEALEDFFNFGESS